MGRLPWWDAPGLDFETLDWLQAAVLGAAVTVFAIALFRYGLQVQFPILRGVLQ